MPDKEPKINSGTSGNETGVNESSCRNVSIKIEEPNLHKDWNRRFKEGEREKLLERVYQVISQVEKQIHLSESEELICKIELFTGISDEAIEREKLDVKKRMQYAGGYTKEMIESKIESISVQNASMAYLNFEIVVRETQKEVSHASNVRVFREMYVDKYEGDIPVGEFVKIIVERLEKNRSKEV